MPLVSVPFQFIQRFPRPAGEVYRWATAYDPKDIFLFGLKGKRKITPLCSDALILADTFIQDDGSRVTKAKLVRLFPERLFWTNTHTTGPNKHSQYLYQLVPEGEGACRLEFTARVVMETAVGDKAEIRALAKDLKQKTQAVWKNLARALCRQR